MGLDNINTLLDFLNRPEQSFPAIHLAGTNGKGSTAAMIYSILENAGYKTGLYTSPHLVDFRERIRIRDTVIPEADVLEFTRLIYPLTEKIKASFFEVTTAMAFWYFQNQAVDIAVIETGMGGRLDSTNVLAPLMTVITPIAYDHTNYLGADLKSIAQEKAGIIKSRIPCITNNKNNAVLAVLEDVCRRKSSPFVDVNSIVEISDVESDFKGSRFDLQLGSDDLGRIRLPLAGEYQIENALLAVGVIKTLPNKMNISNYNIIKGLSETFWPARLQTIDRNPITIVDASHNPEGFRQSLNFIRRCWPDRKLSCIVSLQADKDFTTIGKLLAENSSRTWIVPLKEGKPLNPDILSRTILKAGGSVETVSSVSGALRLKSRQKDDGTIWLIIGSHYLAGEVFELLDIPVVHRRDYRPVNPGKANL